MRHPLPYGAVTQVINCCPCQHGLKCSSIVEAIEAVSDAVRRLLAQGELHRLLHVPELLDRCAAIRIWP